ncbi:hypothetical protein HGRIS_012064 [Hohenbuehelia grisea]|uniref:F-box domain-containing protein n=1 Tax=Hohenbuehelia grisea TaxID=104357 RepID=A0ABR3IR48_9AGAR
MSHIPQEIIHNIVANIHDNRVLRGIALVNRAFLTASRRPAFSQITIDATNALSFLALVESPHCTLTNCRTAVTLGDLDFEGDSAPGHAWLSSALALSQHRAAFAFVHDLAVDFGHYDADYDLTRTLMGQLPIIFPAVTTLTMLWSSYDFIIEIAEAAAPFARLERLVVGRSKVSAVDPSPSPEYALPPPPQSLKQVVEMPGSSVTETLLQWLAKADPPLQLELLDLPQLSRAEDMDDEQDDIGARNPAIEDALNSLSGFLRDLKIDMYKDHCMDSLTQYIRWPAFTALRAFSLTYPHNVPDSALVALLTPMRDLKVLLHLRLAGRVVGEEGSDTAAAFDALFVSPNFPALRVLEFTYGWEAVKERLPVCAARGILVLPEEGH